MRHNLKKKREEKGYTQNDIAKICGISRRHYQRLEAGLVEKSSVKIWLTLEKVLCESIDVLLKKD